MARSYGITTQHRGETPWLGWRRYEHRDNALKRAMLMRRNPLLNMDDPHLAIDVVETPDAPNVPLDSPTFEPAWGVNPGRS